MTREQAAKDYALRNAPVIHEEIAKTSFLAGCEHADKEHMERIEQQAQEIERLKKDAADYMELMSGKVTHQKNRIAELKAQLKEQLKDAMIDISERDKRIAELKAQLNEKQQQLDASLRNTTRLLDKIKALESTPKEQPKKLPISKDFATQLQVQCIINERDQPEAQNLLLLVQTINHQLESRSEEYVAGWLEKNWIVTPREGYEFRKSEEQQNQPEAQQQERILCAAICNPEEKDMAGNTLIFAGLRHVNVLWQSESISRNPRHQGFLTSRGRFVDRKEALKIALENNQVRDVSQIRGDNLYSEDLY